MKIIFLGTGEAFDENFANNSHLIISDKTTLMLDCGDSPVRNLWKINNNPDFLDALYITHRHSDHLFGLPALISRMHEDNRKKDFTIICTNQLKEDITRIMNHAYQGLNTKFSFKINFILIQNNQEINFNELNLKFILSNHTAYNLSIIINNNTHKISYSGDGVIPNDKWTNYKDSDLLIHEAYTYDTDIPGHVKIKDLLKLSENFNIKNLALTHFKRDFIKTELENYKDQILSNKEVNIFIPKPLDEFEL
ncbi:ribonuclease Z [Candidatus Pacearchaeota archaeon]|nr:ribonuclease Z [Candidatus Pacearchaeota archaeon]